MAHDQHWLVTDGEQATQLRGGIVNVAGVGIIEQTLNARISSKFRWSSLIIIHIYIYILLLHVANPMESFTAFIPTNR